VEEASEEKQQQAMTHPSYRPTNKWATKLSNYNSAAAKFSYGGGHPAFYHEDNECLTASETREIVDKLISGPEAFMVWMTVVGHERAKELASKTFSRILQALPNLAPKNTSIEKWLDIQGQIFLTIGDLCLKHNILTVSATKACLSVALMDLPGKYRPSCDADTRYTMSLGIMISKLACRLKFTKSYKALDEKAELEISKKLKNLEV
jgi:hypothetical protein